MEISDHTICPALSILFYMTQPIRLGILQILSLIEAFYSFKVTCILVTQIISHKRNGCVISKIYCLILWSPMCTLLIHVSESVKITGTSATVTYNSMRVDTPGKLLI